MDLAAVRNAIFPQLKTYLGCPVIMGDQAAKKPGYPYLSYKFISSFIPGLGQPAEAWQPVTSSDPNFDYDIEITQQTQPTMTLSVTAYTESDQDQVVNLAMQARNWFTFFGYQYLKENGIVVADLGSIQNRDTLIVGDYERRQGFDVTLRFTQEIKRTEKTIEKVVITGNGSTFTVEE